MNYFNFFEDTQKDKQGMNVPVVAACMLAVAFLVLGGMYLVEKEKNLAAQQDLEYLRSVEANADFQKQLSQVASLNQLVSDAEGDLVLLAGTDWLIDNRTTVNPEILNQIVACFGKKARITSLSITNRNVSLACVATSLADVIEVEMNLVANSEYFRDVFISSVNAGGNNGSTAVSFDLTFTLKEADGQ